MALIFLRRRESSSEAKGAARGSNPQGHLIFRLYSEMACPPAKTTDCGQTEQTIQAQSEVKVQEVLEGVEVSIGVAHEQL